VQNFVAGRWGPINGNGSLTSSTGSTGSQIVFSLFFFFPRLPLCIIKKFISILACPTAIASDRPFVLVYLADIAPSCPSWSPPPSQQKYNASR
jgi:hypothetical protein